MRWRRLALVLCALAAVSLLGRAWYTSLTAPAHSVYHDDGIYLVTAKALAEGRGYRIVSLPGEPPQTKYPPLFPLLLSAAWKAGGGNLAALKAVPLISLVVWLVLVYLVGRRLGVPAPFAFAISLLTAVSPDVFFYSSLLLAEMPCAALLYAAVLALLRVEDIEERAAAVPAALAGVLLGAAFLTRVVILPFAGGVVLAFVLRRRFRAAAVVAGSAGAFIAAWYVWVVLVSSGPDYYSAANYASWQVLSGRWPLRQAVWAAVTNLVWILRAPLSAFGPSAGPWTFLAGALMTAGAAAGLRRAGTLSVALGSLTYMSALVVWVWPPQRMMTLLVPMVLFGLTLFLLRLRRGALWVTVVFAALAGVAVPRTWSLAAAAPHYGAVAHPLARIDWNATRQCLDATRRLAPSSAVLAANLDPLYYLETGRRAVRSFEVDPLLLYYDASGNALGDAPAFASRLRRLGVTHLVHEDAPMFGEAKPLAALENALASAGVLRPIYAAHGCRIYHLETRTGSASGSTSQASRSSK